MQRELLLWRITPIWRDISEGASESEMEQLLADAAMMLRKKMQR